LTETLLRNLEKLPGVEIRFAPDDAAPEIQGWVRKNWNSRPQGPGDLGERMQRAFAEAFAKGAKTVVLIGSDCPAITRDDIYAARARLREHDLVVGPAVDGGYWLIALRSPQPELFKGMPWSTEKVLGETLRRARAMNLNVDLLRILTDIDTKRDWLDFLESK
jgi:rSAM/selenodomain-associated transferase 1